MRKVINRDVILKGKIKGDEKKKRKAEEKWKKKKKKKKKRGTKGKLCEGRNRRDKKFLQEVKFTSWNANEAISISKNYLSKISSSLMIHKGTYTINVSSYKNYRMKELSKSFK